MIEKRLVKPISGFLERRAGKAAYNASIAASKAAKVGVSTATPKAITAMEKAMAARAVTAKSTARKIVYGGGAIGALGIHSMARPNANESRTSYRGPMQTGRGSGRYA